MTVKKIIRTVYRGYMKNSTHAIHLKKVMSNTSVDCLFLATTSSEPSPMSDVTYYTFIDTIL